jgi:hypothetical protein
MPAKAKTSVKKPAAKAKPRRVVSRTAPSVSTSSKSIKKESIWTKPHFIEPQEEFFAKHPNSKILLTLLIAVLIFYFIMVWVNRVEMFPQLFAAY